MSEGHFNPANIRIDNQDQVLEFLEKPTAALSGAVATFLGGPGDVVLIGGRLIQAALQKNLYQQLGRELNDLVDKGKLKKDFFATHDQQSTLHELLKFIDQNPPDEELFRALKSIFFCCVETSSTAETERKTYQFLQISKLLGSGEIRVLKHCWEFGKREDRKVWWEQRGFRETEHSKIMSPHFWAGMMAREMGIPKGLFQVYMDNLLKINLLQDGGGGGITIDNCGLSSFGEELCEFITKFP